MSCGRDKIDSNVLDKANITLEKAEEEFIKSVESMINFYRYFKVVKGNNWNIEILPRFLTMVGRGIENVYLKECNDVNTISGNGVITG